MTTPELTRYAAYSVAVCIALLMSASVVFAAPPQPPWMGFYGTVNGTPNGSTANIDITNASGAHTTASTTGSFGSQSNPLKVYGSYGDTLTVRINGVQVATWSFDDPGNIVQKTLQYPQTSTPTPTPTATPTSNNNGGGGSSGSAGGSYSGGSTSSPSPSPSVQPTATQNSTTEPVTPTPAQEAPTPTASTSSTPQTNDSLPAMIVVILAVLVIAIGAIYFLVMRNK